MTWDDVFCNTFKALRKKTTPEVKKKLDFMLPSMLMVNACRADDFDFFQPLLDSGDLTVDQIVDSDIYLSYNGGAGIDFMVRQAINMAKNRPGGEFIEPLDGNRILLALSRMQQAGSLLEHVTLRDIRFDERYAIIEFVPKAL